MIENLYAKLPPGYILRSSFSVLFGAGGIFMALELRKGDEHFHQKWLMPLVHRLFEPESAHRLGVRAAKMGMFFCLKESRRDFPELHCQLFDQELSSPIGLAAGFDKNGEAIEGLRQHSGFSFIEIGSITPRPQPGNPKPRVFRLIEDQAVINSYGFNSDGLGPVLTRVKTAFDSNSSSSGTTIPLGINLGKNKTTEEAIYDYEIGLTYFAPYSDYLVVNISSPNTPGLRGLQTREELRKLASHLNGALQRLFSGEISKRRPPKLFIKISPDLSKEELKGIAEICLDRRFGIDGLIIGNTTTSRPERMKCAEMAAALAGGLSGAPLRDLSTKCIREMFALTGGRVPIIGCGGISSGQDAYEKIKAGASAVQLYTALVYEGFPVIGKVKRELAEALKRDGYRNVQEAVGADHRRRP